MPTHFCRPDMAKKIVLQDVKQNTPVLSNKSSSLTLYVRLCICLSRPYLRENPQQSREQANLVEQRQRFFIMAVVAVNSATRWRTLWKERKWKMERFAEAMGGGWGTRRNSGSDAKGEEVRVEFL